MNTIEDYISTHTLVQTGYYQLHAASHITDGKPYLIKKFLDPDPQQVAGLKSGVHLARELHMDFILEPVEVFEGSDSLSILYEYFDSVSLRSFIDHHKKLSAASCITIASKICYLLDEFHSRGWMIKNLSPENILIRESDYQCKLGDLRRATKVFKKEYLHIYEKAGPEELWYISPEQTGRIGRITDYRTDFYSLGIILYEMLTGKPPFATTEPAVLIHAHLAIPVTEPIKIDSSIPKLLNDIILKLLSKIPEDRYQSCTGLIYDLSQAAANMHSGKEFRLASKDRVSKIVPTAKLIGRAEPLDTLEQAFLASMTGNKQAVYIKGYSGVGKTRIVQEFYRNRIADKISIVSSKFDILQRNTPYSALLVAMKELIRKLLGEDDENLVYWNSRMISFLKENAAIMIEVIPEMELLTGKQPAADALPPEEARKRFQQTFISFISAFTSDEHFLILFLDDLQWADHASVRLIEMILLDDAVRNFLFIGAYRDNEVEPTHPLSISINRLSRHATLHAIMVEPLEKKYTRELILETLHFPVSNPDAFSEMIFQKTGGNTFFILQLLSSLFEENLLTRNESGEWEWNEKLLQAAGISANVVEFLVEKIRNLTESHQKLLKISACLGDIFDLRTLAMLASEKMNLVAGELALPVNMGYLISLDDHLDNFFKTVSGIKDTELEKFANTRFRFSHDRIRQAALSLLEEEDLARLNLAAARIKSKTYSASEAEDEIFYLANHFNAASQLIDDPTEISQLVYYNQQAGIKARHASAYDAAIRYFECARPHLSFEKNYSQLFDISLQLTESLYLSGRYKEAEELLDRLYYACQSRSDKLNTLFTKVYLYNIQDKKLEAIEAGRKGYSLYNIYMPRNNSVIMMLLLKDVFLARFRIFEKKIDSLLNRKLMQDAEKKRLQEFLLAVAPTIYQYNQNLFAWNIMRMLFASLNYGNNGVSSFSYIGYGMLVSQLFGKYRMGKKLADVAIKLNVQLGYTALKWKVRLSYYNFVQHWTEPVRPELDEILEVENGANANGDPIFAGYAIFNFHQKKFALGFQLKSLQDSFESYLKLCDQRHDLETRHFLEGYYHAILCLRGQEKDTLAMGTFNAPERLKANISNSSYTVAADTFIAFIQTLYMFGHIGDALIQYQNGRRYMTFIQQRYEFAEFNFYGLLTCVAAIQQKIPTRINLKRQVKMHLGKLKLWNDHCPENFEPQYLIASAANAEIKGQVLEAAKLYERAIQSADKYQFVNYKALAAELAGKMQLNAGNTIMANSYLEHARNAYMQWGAHGKVNGIESAFRHLSRTGSTEEKNADESAEAVFASMDLNLVLQAITVVKSEKDIDSLVEQLMKLIIQYSGANNGYLLVKNRAVLIVKARYSTAKGVETMTEFMDNDMLPVNLINYVIRVKQPLILNQPANIPEYSHSRYFEKNRPRSLICHPVLKHGELFGVLYLENEHHEGLFDEKKVSLLNLISAQIAVSLDNAFLYQHLETRVQERTEAIELEKGKVDEMLENILPRASIEELKRTGRTTAQKFENITVLIADIKGFTRISERLTPEELIGKIDFYFRSFDEIMSRHGLEKIKTAGDAYMAVGGLNGKHQEGALKMIVAAMDMQQCIEMENTGVPENEKLEMRIGIHTGTIIAGVVGIKKFQYDIWGDTVNVAARMEQESEPGKINISHETYLLTNKSVKVFYRGKIEAKNKGPMDMYFVLDLER